MSIPTNTDKQDPPSIKFPLRKPLSSDAAGIHSLIRSCPPLDVNSTYCYLLLCTHFASTSVVACSEGVPVGFVSGYRKPETPETLFIWQVAVAESARGTGLAGRMLAEILTRPACGGVRYIETTISPSNKASQRLFESLAARLGTECGATTCFESDVFGDEQHEAEVLYRIGPLTPLQKTPQKEVQS